MVSGCGVGLALIPDMFDFQGLGSRVRIPAGAHLS